MKIVLFILIAIAFLGYGCASANYYSATEPSFQFKERVPRNVETFNQDKYIGTWVAEDGEKIVFRVDHTMQLIAQNGNFNQGLYWDTDPSGSLRAYLHMKLDRNFVEELGIKIEKGTMLDIMTTTGLRASWKMIIDESGDLVMIERNDLTNKKYIHGTGLKKYELTN